MGCSINKMSSFEEKFNSFGDLFSDTLKRNLARAGFSRCPGTGFPDAVICNICMLKLVNLDEQMEFATVHAQ